MNLIWPLSTIALAAPMAAMPSSAWPPATCATVIAPAPGCGIEFMFSPVPPRKDIAATHQLWPTPAVESVTLPGLALAKLIASCTVPKVCLLLVAASSTGKNTA